MCHRFVLQAQWNRKLFPEQDCSVDLVPLQAIMVDLILPGCPETLVCMLVCKILLLLAETMQI